METRNLPLRILYTINSSPQYILARSHSLIVATIIPRNSNSSHYDRSADAPRSSRLESCCATTSLKTCLDTICRSSPELVQDFSRDFSVYVLDPLESNSAPAPVHISDASPSSSSQNTCTSGTTTDQPRGVAVGLGLMSWALLADEADSTAVTGTLITLPTGKEALEVIFALRETAAMQKSSLPTALRSWGLPPLPSKLPRARVSKSYRESKHPQKRLTTTNGKHTSPESLLQGQDTEPSLQGSTRDHPKATGSSTSVLTISHSPPCDTPGPLSASTLATLASIRTRTQTTKPLKSRKAPVIPTHKPPSEADKMMLTKDIYIGPVKKKGRPAKGSISMTDSEADIASYTTNPESGFSSLMNRIPGADGAPTRETMYNSSETHTNFTDPSPESPKHMKSSRKCPKQDTPPSATSTYYSKPSNPTSLFDVLVHLSTSPALNFPNAQNAALLSALSTIDAGRIDSQPGSKVMDNAALVNALRDLISVISSQAGSSPLSNSSPQSIHHKSYSQDDEIIVLDKENVNPSAFRRRAERDPKHVSSDPPASSHRPDSTTQMPFPVSAPSIDQVSPKRTLSVRSNEMPTPTLIPLQTKATTVGEKRRKRTLSDFMDERESSRGGKSREREWAERRDAHRHAYASRNSSMDSSASSLRHYSRLNSLDGLQRRDRSGTNSYYRTGLEPFTSPPRRVNSISTNSEGENTRPYSMTTISTQARVSASSPVRPQSQAPKRKYVVPKWARTQTSTQPRLSEAAQKALEEADERKRGEKRKTACKLEKDRSKRTPHHTGLSGSVAEDGIVTHTNLSSVPIQLPLPIAASEACPVFSVSSETALPPRSFTPELCSSGPSSSTTPIPFPSTPPRKRSGTTLHSPYNCKDSLFTPIPKRWSNSSAGSPLFSPHQALASPLGIGDKRHTLSIDDIVTNKSVEWESKQHNHEAGDEEEEDIENALNKELDSTFGEAETSGSSTTKDADTEIDKEYSTTLDEAQSPSEEDQHTFHIKQHWAGLPPSSPPPPTSPVSMLHEAELESDSRSDDDDMELPVATSDAEEYSSGLEAMDNPNVPDFSSYTNEELTTYLSNSDFGLLFPVAGHSSSLDNTVSSDIDVLDQFTNLTTHPSSYKDNTDMNIDTGPKNSFGTELADFDFTQFWETFKPLVHHHWNENDSHGSSTTSPAVANGSDQFEELDHAKLAEDVQKLFSGCLM